MSYDLNGRNDNFDLVLIQDHFDESLLLLRKMLCWSWDDIAYIRFKQSIQDESEKQAMEEMEMGREESNLVRKIQKWNDQDFKLFKKYNDTLFEKLADYENLEKDLAILRRKCSEMEKECVAEWKTYPEKKWLQYAKLVTPPSDKCVKYTLTEEKFVSKFIDQQEKDNYVNEHIIKEKQDYALQQINRRRDHSAFLQKGNWLNKDMFSPETCQDLEYTMNNKELAKCFKDKSFITLGDKRTTILGTGLKKILEGLTQVKMLWSLSLNEIKKVQIEMISSADFVIIGEMWLIPSDKEKEKDFSEDIKLLRDKILEPLENTKVKILVMAAEDVSRPAQQHIKDESRRKYNDQMRKMVRSFGDNIYFMENNVNTDRDFGGELNLSGGTFKQDEESMKHGLNPSLLTDVNIILSHFCEKRCSSQSDLNQDY